MRRNLFPHVKKSFKESIFLGGSPVHLHERESISSCEEVIYMRENLFSREEVPYIHMTRNLFPCVGKSFT